MQQGLHHLPLKNIDLHGWNLTLPLNDAKKAKSQIYDIYVHWNSEKITTLQIHTLGLTSRPKNVVLL